MTKNSVDKNISSNIFSLINDLLKAFSEFEPLLETAMPSELFLLKLETRRLASTVTFFASYYNFDQLLQTVKNETTVLNLVFKGFLQTSIPLLIFIFYAEEFLPRFSVKIFLSHSTERFCKGTLLCFRKFLLSKNFMHKRGYQDFLSTIFCLTIPKIFVREKLMLSKIFMHERHKWEREVSRFSVAILKLKNVGKSWDSNSYLALQNPVVLPTVPWEYLEFPTVKLASAKLPAKAAGKLIRR